MNYGVVIIGASFSGLTLAHHLPPTLKILVVDSKKALDACVESTGLITQATFDLLSEFVDLKKFIPNQINSIGVIGTDFKRNFFSYTKTPWIYSTDTPQLIKHMSETLPANVTLRITTKYLSYNDTNADTYPLAINLKTTSDTETVNAKFLVGADGAKSSVAASNSKLSKNKKFLVGLEKAFYGDITFGPHPTQAVYHYWFGEFSLGYGGWLSPSIINGRNAFRLGIAKLSKNARDLTKVDAFIKKLQTKKMIKIAHDNEPILTFGSLIPLSGPLRKVFDKNTLLLGDAAGLCGAFAADGIKGAVVSGQVAAKLIPRYLAGDKQALKKYYPEIQKYNQLMTYYRKQVLYRFVWDLMKRDRTFDAMFDIIAKAKHEFLNQFCDSKDRHKSLIGIVLKVKNLPALAKYALLIFLDQFL